MTSTQRLANSLERSHSDGAASVDNSPPRFRVTVPSNHKGITRNPFDVDEQEEDDDVFTTFHDPSTNPFDLLCSAIPNSSIVLPSTTTNHMQLDGVQYVSDHESGDECSVDSEDEEERRKRLSPRNSDLKKKYSPGFELDPTDGVSSRGRNRAMVFMETPAPPQIIVECKLIVLENGLKFDFEHVATRRIWMRAQRRTDGLKSRMNPAAAVHYPIWVAPGLLVESITTPPTAAGDKDIIVDDSLLSFSELMHELEAATAMQADVTSEHALRMGKLKGDPRQTYFQLWGVGSSAHEAQGKLDARPEFLALRMESKSLAKLVVPTTGTPRPRPLTKSEYLMKRAEKKDPTTKTTIGSRTPSVWSFGVEGKNPDLRVIRTAGSNALTVEFHNMSPFQAFAIAIACVSAGLRPDMGSQNSLNGISSSSVQRKESWSSLLTRKVSFSGNNNNKMMGDRRGSLGSLGTEPNSPLPGLPPKPAARKGSLPDTFT